MPIAERSRRPRTIGAAAMSIRWWIAFLAAGVAGCALNRSPSANPERVTASDFAGAPEDRPEAPPTTSAPPRRVIDAATARGGASDVLVLTGAPTIPAPASASTSPPREAPAPPIPGGTEKRLLVDQLVGQINGRPIYANEFFAPMDDRFRREAERLPSREWLAFARKAIEAALWDKLRDDLLLAEFQSGISPEQRQGIVAFIEGIRKDLVSGNLGSPELAQQRLVDTEGLDLESKVKDISQREFIAYQLKRSIGGRVNVAARDIEMYYAQNISDFVPPPVARFIILRVPRRDEAKLAEAEQALAAGEPFDTVAARLSTWRPDAGNITEVEIKDRDYATAALFGPRPLNEAARALTVGAVSPRVDHGNDAYWIRLASIDQKPGISLYDAQQEIEQKLRTERGREEEMRYFEQLFRRGSYSDVKQMTNRLFEFAAERYLIQNPMRKQ